jgi:hypothetical protein
MSYRDDDDAARARADALQRELDLTKKELQESDAESEQLRTERDEADKRAKVASKRAKKLERKNAKKLEPKSPGTRNGATFLVAGVAAVALLVGAVVYVLSVKRAASTAAAPAANTTEHATTEPPVSAEQREREAAQQREVRARQLERKISFYKDCLDHSDQELRVLWRSYEPAATFDELREPLWGIFVDHHLQYCMDAVSEVATVEPPMPDADAAATAYAATLSTLLPLAAKAYLYYDHEDFEDDDYAWARSTFTNLRDELSAAVTAAATLRKVFEPRLREHDTAVLAELNSDEHRDAYLLAKLRQDAREVAGYLLESTAEPARFEQLVGQLDASAEALTNKLHAYDSPPPHIKDSLDQAHELLKHLKLLRRAAKANKSGLHDPRLLSNHYDVVSEFVVFDLSTTGY